MENRVTAFPFADSFTERLAGYLLERFPAASGDFSRLAVVFPGKRPALYLKRALAEKLGRPFFPPAFFSMDEFMECLVRRRHLFRKFTDLEAAYQVYRLNRSLPGGLKRDAPFSRFLPWAREILEFLEYLDLEDVPAEKLENIQKSAVIGYDIPDTINHVLEKIVLLRDRWHRFQETEKWYSRGMIYRVAAGCAGPGSPPEEWDMVVFANLFYLHRTEEAVVKAMVDGNRARVVVQGSGEDWPPLKQLGRTLGCAVSPVGERDRGGRWRLYAGFDTHSQACLVREILKELPVTERARTVIVVPEPASLLPLLSETAAVSGDFNISLGYPLQRSSLAALFQALFRAQVTRRKDGRYYTRDYLRVLSHPLVKNLRFNERDPAVTRILIHRVEEYLLGMREAGLSRSLFIRPREMAAFSPLYESTIPTLQKMGVRASRSDLEETVKGLNHHLFSCWETRRLKNFHDFARVLEQFLELLVERGVVLRYPLNREFIQAVLNIKREVENASFREERFAPEEMFRIFEDRLRNEVVNFSGSPLKGLQILGFLETRSLNFDHIIVMDTNEAVLPALNAVEPLIPAAVRETLGIERRGREEAIQRYHFKRLVAGGRNIHLVYAANTRSERSRFIEELVWERQKQAGPGLVREPEPVKTVFGLQVANPKRGVDKDGETQSFLEGFTFSPSALDCYLKCPLIFYHRYVLGLREKEELAAEPDNRQIGSFMHRLLEEAFQEWVGHKPVIDEHFRRKTRDLAGRLFNEELGKQIRSGGFLAREMILRRLDRFLDFEARRGVARVMMLEKRLSGDLDIGGPRVKFNCRIDRVDRLEDGTLLVIDYKTGGEVKMPAREKLAGMEMEPDAIRRVITSFQLPLYLHFAGRELARNHDLSATVTRAGFYYLKRVGLDGFPAAGEPEQLAAELGFYHQALVRLLTEIRDPAVGFYPVEDFCANCPFTAVCRG